MKLAAVKNQSVILESLSVELQYAFVSLKVFVGFQSVTLVVENRALQLFLAEFQVALDRLHPLSYREY